MAMEGALCKACANRWEVKYFQAHRDLGNTGCELDFLPAGLLRAFTVPVYVVNFSEEGSV